MFARPADSLSILAARPTRGELANTRPPDVIDNCQGNQQRQRQGHEEQYQCHDHGQRAPKPAIPSCHAGFSEQKWIDHLSTFRCLRVDQCCLINDPIVDINQLTDIGAVKHCALKNRGVVVDDDARADHNLRAKLNTVADPTAFTNAEWRGQPGAGMNNVVLPNPDTRGDLLAFD